MWRLIELSFAAFLVRQEKRLKRSAGVSMRSSVEFLEPINIAQASALRAEALKAFGRTPHSKIHLFC